MNIAQRGVAIFVILVLGFSSIAVAACPHVNEDYVEMILRISECIHLKSS